MFSGRLSSSCSTGVTRRITLVTNPLISQELGKYRIVITTKGSICGNLRHRYSVTVNQNMVVTALILIDDSPLTGRVISICTIRDSCRITVKRHEHHQTTQ